MGESFFSKITKVFSGKKKVDDSYLDTLEEILIASDVGVSTTINIVNRLEKRISEGKFEYTSEMTEVLKDEIKAMLDMGDVEKMPDNFSLYREKTEMPYVIMVVGVNGVGKTTTIGKLANFYKEKGNKVVLGACDTFRAAAIEQLEMWAVRNDIAIVKQHHGSDPAAVAFDTISSAKSQKADVVILDTAGRLHNKTGLMEELAKVKRAIQKATNNTAPNEVILVLDGNTGQNAINQAVEFKKQVEITGLVVTKLDGTSKGGVVLSIVDSLKIPIRFIGIGEKMGDIKPFDLGEFVDSLVDGKV